MKFSEEMFAHHMRGITGSAIRDIFKYLAKPGMISFAGGNPSNSALEPKVISALTEEVFSRYGSTLLQYGATEGFAPFRESAAAFLNTEGVSCTAEHILPVEGGTQAFDLLLKVLINPGDVVLCESPTFLGALQAMRIYNARIISVPTDENGVIVEEAERLIREYHPKLFYVIPTFQNPTGITLSLERRKRLAEIANRYGVVLAEDDPYRDLRYSGEALPPIQAFDEGGWVVYMSSFSKYVAPGLRLGAAVVHNPTLLRKMVIGKQSSDVHSPILTQALVDAYLRKGSMPEHLARICGEYRTQLNAMLEGFDLFPLGTTHTVPEGGLFVWAKLPGGLRAMDAFEAAIDANVAFVPGIHFYADDADESTLRLNFSMCDVETIRTGMERLAGVIRSLA